MARDTRIPSNQRFFGDRRNARGFTFLELLLALAVGGLLLAIALPGYRGLVERQRVEKCVRDLVLIAQQIEKYRTMNNFKPPMSLSELGGVPLKDPWGFDYRYLNF